MSADSADLIEIKTTTGKIVKCRPDEIVPKRMGLLVKQRRILLEYLVPEHGFLAHHPITIHSKLVEDLATSDAATVAQRLVEMHRAWLGGVCVEQLAEFIRRLGIEDASTREEVVQTKAREPKRARLEKAPETAKLSKYTREPAIREIFELIKDEQDDALSLEPLYTFVADYLGFGQAEVEKLFALAGGSAEASITFEGFKPYATRLSPYRLGPGPSGLKEEVLIRKAGSLGGFHEGNNLQACMLDSLSDSEVYICTPSAQVTADECKRCIFMFGPIESSLFIRNCEDCIVWVSCQQLRTRDCKRCTFFLYSKTEPIIESSEDLTFAPWSASYPGCTRHFEMLKFDPRRNMWNALFDFTGKADKCNFRFLSLDEVMELRVELNESIPWGGGCEPDNPVPQITHEALCADPLRSEESCGQGVASIPQSRPSLPPPPKAGGKVPTVVVSDEAHPKRQIGAERLRGPRS